MNKLALLTLLALLLSGCRITTTTVGNGKVTSQSGNFNCTNNVGACTKDYTTAGSEVFTAFPAVGWTFAKWTNCSYVSITSCGTSFGKNTAADNWSITATFKPINSPVQTASYTYNALGQRITKKIGGVTTIFQYDLEGNLIAEMNSSGQALRQHIYVDNEPVAQLTRKTDGTIDAQYVHTDHLGTPTLLTNQSGNVVADLEAMPFGETFVDYAEVEYNKRFPGQYKDVETGLHYNYFRDYDPTTGRYVQSDPIGLGGGNNTYTYVSGNPILFKDQTGLMKVYGEWCGPDWTGGFNSQYIPGLEGLYSNPKDALDRSCQTHDICYYKCRKDNPCDKGDRSSCFKQCDSVLSGQARDIGGFYASTVGSAIDRPGTRNPGRNESGCGCDEP